MTFYTSALYMNNYFTFSGKYDLKNNPNLELQYLFKICYSCNNNTKYKKTFGIRCA